MESYIFATLFQILNRLSMRCLIIIISVFFSGAVYAQPYFNSNRSDLRIDTLIGKVTDVEIGKPLAGASVYIPDLKLNVVSDSTGRYHFNNLPKGTYVIEVSY